MISVFTPTYNRSKEIHRVWDSLLNQTYSDFEWIIIDDGSSDDIESVVEEYKKVAPFPIIFFKFKDNRGKHIATNKALKLASGKFFVIADSDDAFTEDALSFFMQSWNELEDKKKFCGIRACCEDQFGNRISGLLKNEPFDGSMSDAFYLEKFQKESWSMVLTEWQRKFPFPENHKDHFFPEGIIWSEMTKSKKFRFFNKVTRIYYVDQTNSITRNLIPPKKKSIRHLARGKYILNNDMHYFFYQPIFFLRENLVYCTYSLINHSFWSSLKQLKNLWSKLLFWMFLPLAIVTALFIRIRFELKSEMEN